MAEDLGKVEDDETLRFLADTHERANRAFALNISFVESYRNAGNATMLSVVNQSKELDALRESLKASFTRIHALLDQAGATQEVERGGTQ